MAAVDNDGGFLVPKRITLGNIGSIAVTVVTAAFIYGAVVTELKTLKRIVDAIPGTYARQVDLDRATRDQTQASADLRTLLNESSETSASVAALTSSVGALRDDIGDLRRRLEVGQDHRPDGGGR